MSLVDYDSDRSEESETIASALPPAAPHLNSNKSQGPKKIIHLERERNEHLEQEEANESIKTGEGARDVDKNSVADILPAPKRSSAEVKASQPVSGTNNSLRAPLSRSSRVLGGAIKSTFDGNVGSPLPMKESSGTATASAEPKKIIPAAVLARKAKYGDSYQAKQASEVIHQKINLPSLFTFKSCSREPSKSKGTTYEPVMIKPSEPAQPATQADPAIESSSPEANEGHNIVKFNVDDFYQSNLKKRKTGALEESKRPVSAVGGSQNNLSSLIRKAQENQSGLEETFLQNKRNKKATNSKYGF